MRKIVLVVDESGEKAYSKKTEHNLGDLGVMCGFLLSEQDLNLARDRSRYIFSQFNSSGKCHLTDLTKHEQAKARELLINIFRSSNICWFYEAIYSQGFHQSVHKENRSGSGEKELLHAKLFSGVFGKALVRILHDGNEALQLTVITDPVDKATIKKFEMEVNHFIAVIQQENITRKHTEYDKKEKNIKNIATTTRVKIADNNFKFDSIKYSIQCEDTYLTFVADILSNMTHYYLKKNQIDELGIPLNSAQAIINHPLKDLAFAMYDKYQEEIGSISDIIYRRENDCF